MSCRESVGYEVLQEGLVKSSGEEPTSRELLLSVLRLTLEVGAPAGVDTGSIPSPLCAERESC